MAKMQFCVCLILTKLSYLDAYPTNKKALAFYQEHRKILAALKEEYRQKYGPLTIYDNVDPNEWDWVKGPWPWEREAN